MPFRRGRPAIVGSCGPGGFSESWAVPRCSQVCRALGGCTSSHPEPSPAAQQYSRIGTVEGVTFWMRTTGSRVSIRATGRLGDLCNASGSPGYSRLLLCDETGARGGIQAGFVPDGAKSASVVGFTLTVIPAPGPFDLAVRVVGPGQELQSGPLLVS